MQLVSSVIFIDIAKIFSTELLSFYEEIKPSCPDSVSFTDLSLNVQNTELGEIEGTLRSIVITLILQMGTSD